MPFGSGLTKPHWMEAQNETIRAELGGRVGGSPDLVRHDPQPPVYGVSMSAKEYRPWEMPRIIGRRADCGDNKHLADNGLCADCEQLTRGKQAFAPAFTPATSERMAVRPDGQSHSCLSWPTTQSAGSARFYGRSRDTW